MVKRGCLTQQNPQTISLGKKHRRCVFCFCSQLEADGTGVDDLLQVLDVVSWSVFFGVEAFCDRGEEFVVV